MLRAKLPAASDLTECEWEVPHPTCTQVGDGMKTNQKQVERSRISDTIALS